MLSSTNVLKKYQILIYTCFQENVFIKKILKKNNRSLLKGIIESLIEFTKSLDSRMDEKFNEVDKKCIFIKKKQQNQTI